MSEGWGSGACSEAWRFGKWNGWCLVVGAGAARVMLMFHVKLRRRAGVFEPGLPDSSASGSPPGSRPDGPVRGLAPSGRMYTLLGRGAFQLGSEK